MVTLCTYDAMPHHPVVDRNSATSKYLLRAWRFVEERVLDEEIVQALTVMVVLEIPMVVYCWEISIGYDRYQIGSGCQDYIVG